MLVAFLKKHFNQIHLLLKTGLSLVVQMKMSKRKWLPVATEIYIEEIVETREKTRLPIRYVCLITAFGSMMVIKELVIYQIGKPSQPVSNIANHTNYQSNSQQYQRKFYEKPFNYNQLFSCYINSMCHNFNKLKHRRIWQKCENYCIIKIKRWCITNNGSAKCRQCNFKYRYAGKY